MSKIEEHKEKTISGLKWSGLIQVIKQFLTIGISIILARLLSPNEFGLIGMVTVITGFMQLFNDFGFGAALIQKNNNSQKDLSSVFWFNLFTGIVFCLALIILSPQLAKIFNNSQLEELIVYISFIFIIQAFGYVQLTTFKKNLDFKSIFISDIFSVVISGAIAIFLAFMGYGVISLVAQLLIASFVSILVLWILSSWRPSFHFSFLEIKQFLNFSVPLLGSNILGYSLGNLDKLLIGRYLGTIQLGIYSRAYSLMVFPVTQISGVISQVMFPSLAQIQDDKDRIKSIYLKMNRVISFVTFPLMVMAFILAEPFILVFFGEKWIPMVIVFKILTIVGALQSVGTLIGNVFMALGEMKVYLRLNFLSGIVFTSASILGISYGVNGVSVALTIATFIVAIPQWYIAGKLINITIKEYLFNLIPNAFSALIFLGIMMVFSWIFDDLSYVNQLFIFPIVGIIFLGIIIYFFNRNSLIELMKIIKKE